MPIMTQIEASFCGEGAEQIHEWAKDGSEGIFFARVFRKDYLRVKSANTWEGWGEGILFSKIRRQLLFFFNGWLYL